MSMTGGGSMKIDVRGVHTVRVRKPDGSVALYRYHRASKARLYGEPGSDEFLASYQAAQEAWRQSIGSAGKAKSIAGAIAKYKASIAFTDLSPRTRADYSRMFSLIEARFGRAPLAAFRDPRVRADIIDWRDEIAKTSRRTADMAVSVLGMLINNAIARGEPMENHALKIGRIYDVDRSEKIWPAEMVETFMATARPELRLAMTLALNTGQRQGDLLRLTWVNYDGERIRLRQSKTGALVTIPCTAELKAALDAAPGRKGRMTILCDSRGMPWKGNGFRLAWRRHVEACGLKDAGLTFHDLRGTAVTALADAGCTESEIAAITGHSPQSAGAVLKRYLARTSTQSDGAIAKLERARARTKTVK